MYCNKHGLSLMKRLVHPKKSNNHMYTCLQKDSNIQTKLIKSNNHMEILEN